MAPDALQTLICTLHNTTKQSIEGRRWCGEDDVREEITGRKIIREEMRRSRWAGRIIPSLPYLTQGFRVHLLSKFLKREGYLFEFILNLYFTWISINAKLSLLLNYPGSFWSALHMGKILMGRETSQLPTWLKSCLTTITDRFDQLIWTVRWKACIFDKRYLDLRKRGNVTELHIY